MDPEALAWAVRTAGLEVLDEAAALRRRIDVLRWACEDLEGELSDLEESVARKDAVAIVWRVNLVVSLTNEVVQMIRPLE
jgi:hypothetical protein